MSDLNTDFEQFLRECVYLHDITPKIRAATLQGLVERAEHEVAVIHSSRATGRRQAPV